MDRTPVTNPEFAAEFSSCGDSIMKMVHEWLSRPNPYYKATRHRDSSAGISGKYQDWHHWFFRLVVGVTLKTTKWKSSELPRPVGDDVFRPICCAFAYLAPNDPDFWEFRPRMSRKKLGNPQKVVNSQNRGPNLGTFWANLWNPLSFWFNYRPSWTMDKSSPGRCKSRDPPVSFFLKISSQMCQQS